MKKQRKNTSRVPYPSLSNVISTTECTGLMPALPLDESEYAAYQTLSDQEIPLQKDTGTNQKSSN